MKSLPHPSRHSSSSALLAAALLLLAAACGDTYDTAGEESTVAEATEATEATGTTPATPPIADPSQARRALALIHGREGSDLSGTVAFTAAKDSPSVLLEVDLRGLEPGTHGFHLHELGDCSAADFTSAGGHFAPAGHAHGAPDQRDHHAGDFGNVEADEEGTVTTTLSTTDLSLLDPSQDPRSAIGRAIIVHAGADDLESQPSGDAGARVGCGVVEGEELTETSS